MTEYKTYKQVRFRLSSWNKLRRAFYGRKNETYSDYIERLSKELKQWNVKLVAVRIDGL